MICQKCGKVLSKNAKFCDECGKKVASINKTTIKRDFPSAKERKAPLIIVFIVFIVVTCAILLVINRFYQPNDNNQTQTKINTTTNYSTKSAEPELLEDVDIKILAPTSKPHQINMGNGIILEGIGCNAFVSDDGQDIELKMKVKCLSENDGAGRPFMSQKVIRVYDKYGTLMTGPTLLFEFDYNIVKDLKVGDTVLLSDVIYTSLLDENVTPYDIGEVWLYQDQSDWYFN